MRFRNLTTAALDGAVKIQVHEMEGGKPVKIGKGDLVTFPAGMSCVWKVHKLVRKHYKFG